jgi:hypothetical protein
MLDGGSLAGIDISQIDTSIIAIKHGDSNTSLPSEGWLWVDGINSLWVKTAFGNVKLYRAGWGGWETRRFIVEQTKHASGLPGAPQEVMVDLISASGDSGNPIFCRTDVDSPNGRWSLKACETAESGTYLRCIGRGGHIVLIRGAENGMPKYVARNSLGFDGFDMEPFPNTVTFRGARGLVMDRVGGGTEHEDIYWHYGVRIMQD